MPRLKRVAMLLAKVVSLGACMLCYFVTFLVTPLLPAVAFPEQHAHVARLSAMCVAVTSLTVLLFWKSWPVGTRDQIRRGFREMFS